ncbi:MAG TPA: nuclear transport factor 2 family protein, partial [Candidatus Limnocylindrales bacterium]
MTPREVHARLLEGISTGQFHTLADLYAEDAVVEIPLAITTPRRLEGRETIRRHFEVAANGPLSFKVGEVLVY